MWIEYELNCKSAISEKGMFNAQHIRWLRIEKYVGGQKDSIEIYLESSLTQWIFITAEENDIKKIFDALIKSMGGASIVIPDIGYIRPLQRPFFNDQTTLIPSAYRGEP